MTEDRNRDVVGIGELDIVGAGKLAEAIPAESWNQVVNTACDTFKSLLAPLTSVTSGTGRLISARFDRLVDGEKLLATQMLESASKKASDSTSKSDKAPRTSMIIKVIEASSTETDETLQELWSNLLANELVDNSIHPEFIQILSRLSSTDAYRLIELAERSDPPKKVTLSFKIFGFEINLRDIVEEPTDFTNIHLSNLGLIERPTVEVIENGIIKYRSEVYWSLTIVGKAFISAVTNPAIESIEVDKKDLDVRQWDEQLERDIADGKLESLAQEAISEFENGNCQEL